MNSTLTNFARNTLKEDLSQCTDSQLLLFKRMYSSQDLTKEINLVIDDMSDGDLDWAMVQVKNTLEKNKKL